ncbi:twin-arginine translocation pathway signal [Paramagnetospirillum marisnigri]|uniref:Twin-arginine translocation pathway signal n=1 Tax=Paramagnetospirillum marisnigri TaxID=1285242 RepID=A0A178ML27_9PROT|nr:NAD(P)-binding protein [Paramagnetospirillum marisnigri]OAN49309.1 twin-arginine translocation pathway signal [Paramagnetospirillum marisnigri]
MPSRRDVLRQVSALGAGLLMPRPGVLAEERPDYALPEWTGDNFDSMHAIRDGHEPRAIPKPERRVEVVIIGGGLTGLAVATLLSDSDFVLLERENTMGGNAKAGQWRGIDYALGSAYLADTEEPYGPFYDSLGLTLTPVSEPADRVLTGSPDMADALQGPLRRPYAKLVELLAAASESKDFPRIPIETATSRSLALDQIPFSEYLRREQVSAALMPMIDAYCWSSLGGGANGISAYCGINFLSEIAAPIYAFPGGNAALAKAMTSKINRSGGKRLVGGASVFAVEPDANGRTLVGYLDHSSGEARAVSARWVVVAAPYFFAGRIIRGIDPAAAGFMKGLSHGSYLVANCCFSGRQLPGPYDSWTPSNPGFTDFVSATASLSARARPQDRDVITIYAPFTDPAAGRVQLLAGNQAAAAKPVVDGLRRFAPDFFANSRLEEVRLTRYGHQLLTSRVGLVAAMRRHEKRFGNILLAHSDGQGMSAVESAIVEAHRAAETILSRR